MASPGVHATTVDDSLEGPSELAIIHTVTVYYIGQSVQLLSRVRLFATP